jgi:hypothetical protein
MIKAKDKSHLLIDENPLVLLPSLAEYIGLEFNTIGDRYAIALQQVHYWLDINKKSESKKPVGDRFHFRDGRWWTYNTYQQWHEESFRFWKERLIRKIFSELEEMGLIISAQFWAGRGIQTKWYTIDYESLEALYIKHSSEVTESDTRLTESVSTPQGQVAESVGSYTETSFSKTSSETSFHIDTFLGQKSDTGETQTKIGVANQQEAQPVGVVSPQDQKQDNGARETHETQNETVEPPKRKMNWRPGKILYYETDQNDRIIYPKITDLHPSVKVYYSGAIETADQETKQWIIENGFVNSITEEEDDDGDVYIDTLNEEYALEEALEQIPLAQMFQLGVHPDHGSLSAEEYNEYWASRFINYITEFDNIPL